MTFIKQAAIGRAGAGLRSGSPPVAVTRPTGPLTTRVVELMDGSRMLVMRQATLDAAVQAGKASLRDARSALKRQADRREPADG